MMSVRRTTQTETDRQPQTDQPTEFDQPIETDRMTFFSCTGGELDGCNTFAEVQLVAQRRKEEMRRYVPPFPSVSGPVGTPVDRSAWLLVDTEVQNRCFPLDVQADGNCLFRSISLMLFGSERHHTELRCRTVLEVATNP